MRVMRPHKKTHGLRTSQRKDTKNIPICVLKKQPLAKLQHLAVINHSINLFFNIIPPPILDRWGNYYSFALNIFVSKSCLKSDAAYL